MKLKKLSLKNIRSYESLEIEFPNCSFLLSGNIGVGKSTILLAIEYALFGLQPGQKGASLLRNTEEQGEVKLEFEIDKIKVEIERTLKKSGKGVLNDLAAISINGEREEASITEIKTKILTLLGYPLEFVRKTNSLFRYTVFTPQEQMKQIITEEPEIRLNLIRNIFGIDKYKRIKENLEILLSKIKDEIKSFQIEIKNLSDYKDSLKRKQDSLIFLNLKLSEKSEELKVKIETRKKIELELLELESKIKEKENLENEVEKTQLLLKTKKDYKYSIEREIVELNRELEQNNEKFNQEEYNFLIKDLEQLNEKIESLYSKQLEISSNINSMETRLNENKNKKGRIFNMNICPSCLQDVPEFHKHNILNETESVISYLTKQISFFKNELENISNQILFEKTKKQKLNEMKSKFELIKSKEKYLENILKKIDDSSKLKNSIENDILFLDKHLTFLKDSIRKLSIFDIKYKKIKISLEEALSNENSCNIENFSIQKEIEISLSFIKEMEEFITKKEKVKIQLESHIELYDWLSSNFKGLIEHLERNILIGLRKEFSDMFNKWFKMLVDDDTLKVELDDSFSPIIIKEDFEMDYSFLSGGERTAVALAYRLALNQTVNLLISKIKTNDLLILDEPTEGFSEAQIEKIPDILNELKISQIIIVSHEQKMESFLEEIIKIGKEDDSSFVYKNYNHKT
jgi:exonuclease SbcC